MIEVEFKYCALMLGLGDRGIHHSLSKLALQFSKTEFTDGIVPPSHHFGFWIGDFGLAILDWRFWIGDFGFWIGDFGLAILDFDS
jgi:hypothetical protein